MNKLMNRDIKRDVLILLLENYKEWKTLIKNGFCTPGMFENIEIDIRNFVETFPHYKKDLISRQSMQVSRIEMDSPGNLIMSLTFEMTIKEGMTEYGWPEDDESEEEYTDIEGTIEVSTYFINWKLDKIDALIVTSESEDTLEYSLWPDFDMPVYFNGTFGQKLESTFSNLSKLLEVRS